MRVYHDATIDSFRFLGQDVVLELEGVVVYGEPDIEDGTRVSGYLIVRDVQHVYENENQVLGPSWRFSYGKVLDLTVEPQHVMMLVRWKFAETRETEVAQYRFSCSGASWLPRKPPSCE